MEIMLIEDKEDDILLAKLGFKELNINANFCIAKTGVDAIEKINSRVKSNNEFPKLIILDINLPILNGIEVLEQINSMGIINKVPVVIFTSTDSKADIDYCYKLGARCFVKKPNNIYEIKNTIKQILSKI